LIRIESKAFYNSSLESIVIPSTVEILGSNCFSFCESLSSITFESNSHLTRIESETFFYSSFQSIVIPRSVQFIDGSAFIGTSISSISIELENELFVVENNFLIDVLDHKLIRNFSKSSNIEIGRNIEILGSQCFSYCESLSSISFESTSRLIRIESKAFYNSSLESIVIPSTVEILGSKCFSACQSLSSISFESNSRLMRIESKTFYNSSIESIVIPSTVDILGSKCFSFCKLSSISFESNSRLIRIESFAFSWSRLESIVIPRNVQFIDGSAFARISISSISIESGNERFVVENEFLIDIVHHKLIRNFSKSSNIEIGSDIEIIG
jgi:hypothetical protein